ncbi:MAG: DUF4011 domain-containing protein [Flavobacteriales bacterium]|nr:DUF4011 domain-containing protein [Flavobacteriales bacterium]
MPVRELIEQNLKYWVEKLVDTSRRNNLLFLIPENRDKVLNFGNLDTPIAKAIFQNTAISLKSFYSGDNLEKLNDCFQKIVQKAKENEEERSIQTLFLGVGLFKWKADDGNRDFCAPALLMQIETSAEVGNRTKIKFSLTGDVDLNRSLQVYWRTEHNVSLSEIDEYLEELASDDGVFSIDGIRLVLDYLIKSSRNIPGIDFDERVVISNFAFQKLALLQDLEGSLEALVNHEIIGALCGDQESIAALSNKGTTFSPDEIDLLNAEDDYTFLPTDSSQFTVIRNVLNGKNGVIQGPPGTGKSQTIANLIAELVSRGKKVLFVAEKKAALEVVHDRLKNNGLGDFVLDLHGQANRGQKLSDQLRNGLALQMSRLAANESECFHNWQQLRDALNEHGKIFHSIREPWQITVYEAICQNLYFEKIGLPHFILKTQRIFDYTKPVITEARQTFSSFQIDLRNVSEKSKYSWRNTETIPDKGVEALRNLAEKLKLDNSTFKNQLKIVEQNIGKSLSDSINTIQYEIGILKKHNDVIANSTPAIWNENLDYIITELTPYRNTQSNHLWRMLFKGRYRKSYSKAKKILRSDLAPLNIGIDTIAAANKVQEYWAPNEPKHSELAGIDQLQLCNEVMLQTWNQLAIHLPILSEIESLEELESAIETLNNTKSELLYIQSFLGNKNKLKELDLLSEAYSLENLHLDSSKWADVLEYSWNKSILQYLYLNDIQLSSFKGEIHESNQKSFAELDKTKQKITKQKILRSHAVRMTETLGKYPLEFQHLQSQSLRKRPQSFKKVFLQAPNAVLSVFPCWMASPLTVTQLLDSKRTYFDVVLFDEASQIQPEDAISSILRAKQIVVSGDTRQLPPTTFFADTTLDDDGDGVQAQSSGFESLLQMIMAKLPNHGPMGDGWFLEWHYRSKDESLIAFSNHHIYNNRMITFPNQRNNKPVDFIEVKPMQLLNLSSESESAEVEKVVELSIQIARSNPNKSLGIIALGIKHAQRIEASLNKAIEKDKAVWNFFSEDKKEPFFVKNLERVQGDERDIIVLSIGYGQERTGSLSHNFGPINKSGGERRLNVAITRSRERMLVVASFNPSELDPARCTGKGPSLLRKYLMYASSGGRNLGLEIQTETQENIFESMVRMALEPYGLKMTPQLGVSNFRLDIAVHHPDRPGEYIMAIECDGASYHSSKCARDRDRLRQEFLETLGWKFHRIWSTHWFHRREEEIQKVLKRYQELLDENNAEADELQSKDTQTNELVQLVSTTRTVKPRIEYFESIQDYRIQDLISIAKWILSDGILRTKEQLFEELFLELGFSRRGPIIVQTLERVAIMALQ